MAEQMENYVIKSNRESGFGRYDIMMLPKKEALPGIIMDLRSMEKMYWLGAMGKIYNISRIPYSWYWHGRNNGWIQQEQYSCTGWTVYARTGKSVKSGCTVITSVRENTINIWTAEGSGWNAALFPTLDIFYNKILHNLLIINLKLQKSLIRYIICLWW